MEAIANFTSQELLYFYDAIGSFNKIGAAMNVFRCI